VARSPADRYLALLVEAIDRLLEATRAEQRDDTLQPLEDACAKSVRAGFKAQGKAFLSGFAGLKGDFAESRRLREADETPAWEPIWDDAAAAGDPTLEDAIDAGARAGLEAGGTAITTSLGLETAFDLSNPEAVRYLDGYAAERVTAIDETTRDTLNRLITGGVQEGKSYEKIAASIRDEFDNWAEPQAYIRDRAEMVAITEVGQAYEHASRSVVNDLVSHGLEYEKSWLAEADACEHICAPNQDEGWIAIDQQHQSGDDTPLGHPGCRCTELYRRVGSTTEGEG
jgi:hypothetical protein